MDQGELAIVPLFVIGRAFPPGDSRVLNVSWRTIQRISESVPSEAYAEIGKTFKGLTDKQFKWMTEKFLSLKKQETAYTVHVEPSVVVEVAYNEIQRSPQYESGFALRFARIKRIRENKSTSQVQRKIWE